ncbi:hypothetical protein GMJAKD_10365 [Candidatus Electrothrix aarhusensis]
MDTVRKAPHDARAKLNLANWYIGGKKYKKALVLCQQAENLSDRETSVNTTVPIALNLRGTIAYEQDKPEKAATYFQQAYSLRKDYTAVAEKLIATLVELERYDEALAVITERYAIKNDASLLLLKASVFLRQGKPTEALATYRQAELFYQALPLVMTGKAKAFIMKGNHDQAAPLLVRAARQNDAIAMLLQIENNLLSGQESEASVQLKKLVEKIPLVRLLNDLNAAEKDPFQIPLDRTLLRQAILHTAVLMLSGSQKEETL